MTDGLLRQRRNLLITCILLCVMQNGGVTLKKMSMAGFDIDFSNPSILVQGVWIAYAYFLFRYYQYFANEGVGELQKVFEAAMDKKCERHIHAFVKKRYPNCNDAHLYSYGLLKLNNGIYRGQAPGNSYYDPATGSVVGSDDFILPINWRVFWKGTVSAFLDTTFRNSVVTDYLLPFAVALYVLYSCGSHEWGNSFLNL
jgi:hypothetical protein